jgi:hypothetical protein
MSLTAILRQSDILTNTREVFTSATRDQYEQGLAWYRTANGEGKRLARLYKVPLARACETIAALSPSVAWDRNLYEASLVLEAAVTHAECPTVSTYGPMKQIAWNVARGEARLTDVCKGPKVRAFADNLTRPDASSEVTIDRHAVACACGTPDVPNAGLTALWYRRIAEVYRTLAEETGLRPCEVQAIVWVTWRDRWAYWTPRTADNYDEVPF